MATRSKPRRRGYKKNITWAGAARAAGAIYPGGHAKEGKVMSKAAALQTKKPVPGFLTPSMIKSWHTDASGTRKGSKKYKAAFAELKESSSRLRGKRKKRKAPWKMSKAGRSMVGKKRYKAKKKGAAYKSKPYTTVRLTRGQHPSKRTQERLKALGFAGSARARGGKMALNPRPRRKKKKARRRRNPSRARDSKGKFLKKGKKATTRKRKTKKKSTAKKRPAKKKKATKRRYRKNPKTKTKRNSKGRFVKSGGGTRKRKKKSSGRGRSSYGHSRKGRAKKSTTRQYTTNPRKKKRKVAKRRYRRNPGVMGALKAQWKKFSAPPVWITATHALIGMGATMWLDGTLNRARFVPLALKRRGITSVALCAGSGLLVSTGAFLLEGVVGGTKSSMLKKATANLGTNVLIGSVITVAVKAAYELAPRLAAKARIPQISGGRVSAPMPADLEGMGSRLQYSDGPDYTYGFGGTFGSIMSPQDLVETESLSRQVNQFHGLGGQAGLGQPVPIEDIRGLQGQGSGVGDWMELSGYPGQYGGGYSGMGQGQGMGQSSGVGDWVEFLPDSAISREVFNPAQETF